MMCVFNGTVTGAIADLVARSLDLVAHDANLNKSVVKLFLQLGHGCWRHQRYGVIHLQIICKSSPRDQGRSRGRGRQGTVSDGRGCVCRR